MNRVPKGTVESNKKALQAGKDLLPFCRLPGSGDCVYKRCAEMSINKNELTKEQILLQRRSFEAVFCKQYS